MSIQVIWDDENKTVIHQRYEGQWTWDEFFATSKQINEMIKELPQRVDIIVDMQKSTMPKNGAPISAASSVMRAAPPNRGVVVVVTNAFFKVLLGVFKRVDTKMGSFLFGADSLEQARVIIQRERSKQSNHDL